MGAVHCGVGAEIEIAVAVRIQDGLKTRLVGDTDRAWRETFIQIGVVRGIVLQMLEQNPVEGVTIAEGHGRIGLEPHSLMQAVQIHTGD